MWESIFLCESAKNRWGMGTAYRYLGSVYLAEGQYTEALAHFQKSLEVFGEYTIGWDIALSLIYLGDAVRLSDNLDEARKIYQRALQIALDAHSTPIALQTLLGLAHLCAQTDEPERAFELSYYISEHPSSTQETIEQAGELLLETEKMVTSAQVQAIKEGVTDIPFDDYVKLLAQM